jgi:hypothetical protein
MAIAFTALGEGGVSRRAGDHPSSPRACGGPGEGRAKCSWSAGMAIAFTALGEGGVSRRAGDYPSSPRACGGPGVGRGLSLALLLLQMRDEVDNGLCRPSRNAECLCLLQDIPGSHNGHFPGVNGAESVGSHGVRRFSQEKVTCHQGTAGIWQAEASE